MPDFERLPHKENLSPKGIWVIAQNKPSLIARDLEEYGIPKRITYAILLARGVFKWLAVRRYLIRMKDRWKNSVKIVIELIKVQKALFTSTRNKKYLYKLYYYRGYLKALEDCRKEIRLLCHSERWQAPDFDADAIKFLESLEKGD